ncbi:MAG: hypothetical protein Q9181_002804 [Wetmoreana brouardii]
MPSLYSYWTQTFPGSPSFTESSILSQTGRVFIVTGGNSGIGFELVKILYSKGGTVYMASRSEPKASAAIKNIEESASSSLGKLHFLHLDLDDLHSVRASAAAFAAQESRLDVLWNNAGISAVPNGSKTKQGIEQHIGDNCVAPLLFSQLLLPQLRFTAADAPKSSVRVVWTSSFLVDTAAPPGGLVLAELTAPLNDPVRNYAASKAGNWFLAAEWARRFADDDILSLTQNPGSLSTDIWRHTSRWLRALVSPLLYKPIYGAYTEAWAGLSPVVTMENAGQYAIPWGRWHPSPRKDILKSLETKDRGGTGVAEDFWDWCEGQINSHPSQRHTADG